MANSKQATKRVRQAQKRRELNVSQLSEMRTYVKRFLKAYATKQYDGLADLYAKCVKQLDKGSSRGLIHKNKAARLKSRLNQKLKAVTS